MKRIDTKSLVKALRILAQDPTMGVAGAIIAEAAKRIEELERDQADIAFIAYQQGRESTK